MLLTRPQSFFRLSAMAPGAVGRRGRRAYVLKVRGELGFFRAP